MKKTIAARCRNMGATMFLLLLSLFSFSQNNFKVTGIVKDESGKPVDGATVGVKGTSTATATKADGSFELLAPTGKAILVITHVGFTEFDYPLQGQSNVTITVT